MTTDDVIRVLRALEALGYFSFQQFEWIPEGEMAEDAAPHVVGVPGGQILGQDVAVVEVDQLGRVDRRGVEVGSGFGQ